jgi:hypothetical protein
MTTKLLKPISRVTVSEHRGRRIVVTMVPGDFIELRESGRRKSEIISIAGVMDFAIKCRVSREQFEKKNSKKKLYK